MREPRCGGRWIFCCFLAITSGAACSDDVADDDGAAGKGGTAGVAGRNGGASGIAGSPPASGGHSGGEGGTAGGAGGGPEGGAGESGTIACGDAGQGVGGSTPVGGVGGDAGGGVGGVGGDAGSGGSGGKEAPSVEWLGACLPLDLSEDGRTVLAREGVWRAETGWLLPPDLPGGTDSSVPSALSKNGEIVFGLSSSDLGDELYRWEVDGVADGLGVTHEVYAANDDGSVWVGFDASDTAILWSEANGYVPLQDLDLVIYPDDRYRNATISSDGTIVTASGYWQTSDSFLYSTTHSFPSWRDIHHVTAMSGDGLRIAFHLLRFGSNLGAVRRTDGSPGGSGLPCTYVPDEDDALDPGGTPCSTSHVGMTDLDYLGQTGVAAEWANEDYLDWGANTLFEILYWSGAPPLIPLREKLAQHGLTVPIPGGRLAGNSRTELIWPGGEETYPPFFISADGRTFLGIALHDAIAQCFLARI